MASESTKNVFAVVVGGGVVGTSVAYHLTKRNIKDVVILERRKLASGTTHHSVIFFEFTFHFYTCFKKLYG